MSHSNQVLVLDDEQEMLNLLENRLKREGYQVIPTTHAKQALELFTQNPSPVVILDIVLECQPQDGMTVLRQICQQRPETQVIMLTGHPTIDTAIEASHFGAIDYIRKGPQMWEEIVFRVQKAFRMLDLIRQNRQLQHELKRVSGFAEMVGQSPAMQKVYQLIKQVAPKDATVLIQGETGTGKELIARAIHDQSLRKDQQWVVVECSNISEELLRSELFGHKRGAFTGADRDRMGLFEMADRSTIFLDDIQSTPMDVQGNLLRAIQEGEIRRTGSNETIKVDVRIIVATNANLAEKVEKGEFREDLFFRLNVFPIVAPPLRERKEDIPLLTDHFLQKYWKKNRPIPEVSQGARQVLGDYNYPGNVRELENIIERATILTSGDIITPEDVQPNPGRVASQNLHQMFKKLRLRDAHDLTDRFCIDQRLRETRGNVRRAAELLGIDRSTLNRTMKRLEMSAEDYRTQS